IPTEGAHNDYGVDLGNLYDRRYQFDYVSAPHQEGAGRPARIEWQAETPFGSKMRFQLRAAPAREKLEGAPWLGPKGESSYYDSSGSGVQPLQGPWFQYRAIFWSPDGVNYPILT